MVGENFDGRFKSDVHVSGCKSRSIRRTVIASVLQMTMVMEVVRST